MSSQRERSAVEAAHRSILPSIAGVPWWAALLIATSATVIGYAIDAGHKELTHVFAGCYIAGCVIAVLAVRQSGVFTAVIQPPLLLFCAVPGAYWLFHGGNITKVKDLLINCGYPLIERFPLMLGTAGVVLLIGLIRWYFGMTQRPADTASAKAGTASTTESKPLFSGIATKLTSLLHGAEDEDDTAEAAHAVNRAARTSPKSGRAARNSRSAQRPARTRSRHARPALEDQDDPTTERPRRQSRRAQPPARDFDDAEPPRRSRRQRPQGDPDPRSQPRRESRRDPYGRRSYERERPASRSGRFDPYEAYEPPPEQFDRYQKPSDRYEPPRRRSTPGGSSSANPTHHPISQVRYRGSGARDERREEPHADRREADGGDPLRPAPPRSRSPRGRSRAPRRPQAESWEYDI